LHQLIKKKLKNMNIIYMVMMRRMKDVSLSGILFAAGTWHSWKAMGISDAE